jgi:hypothetical protein
VKSPKFPPSLGIFISLFLCFLTLICTRPKWFLLTSALFFLLYSTHFSLHFLNRNVPLEGRRSETAATCCCRGAHSWLTASPFPQLLLADLSSLPPRSHIGDHMPDSSISRPAALEASCDTTELLRHRRSTPRPYHTSEAWRGVSHSIQSP